MSRKLRSEEVEEKPLRKKNIASDKLVQRKRAADGAVIRTKQRVNIYLDSAVVEHFKALAGERGYQTLINEALKESIRAQSLEKTIRYAIRQELKEYKV